ncbi:uncharacterized protein LOC129594200 isoform X2 [Paramacrobiotus metropolitanus]|uniref:uncharacterized protein LOC129594200 isoform X2 n=1 Tax=Paramacrobiotus metropolitanus TaxID=2943436 RepID=UPI002445F02E|nr:uncharacterized protein LOC129594200 isoform X2 [Paramacrobiotus metropolitanus]
MKIGLPANIYVLAYATLCFVLKPFLAHAGNSAKGFPRVRECYECTSGVNDGCDDPARVAKWAFPCPEGTQGCLKMKAPGSPLIRSCGNPHDSPVPIKDGCVNKPGVGIICSCSTTNLCNAAAPASFRNFNRAFFYMRIPFLNFHIVMTLAFSILYYAYLL